MSSLPAKPRGQKRGGLSGFLPSDNGLIGAATSPVQPASYAENPSAEGIARHRAPRDGVASSTVILGDGPLVTVPDFSGWAARRVAEECEKLGLDLNVAGTGLAVEQNPVAGVKIPSGTRVWVRMAR